MESRSKAVYTAWESGEPGVVKLEQSSNMGNILLVDTSVVTHSAKNVDFI